MQATDAPPPSRATFVAPSALARARPCRRSVVARTRRPIAALSEGGPKPCVLLDHQPSGVVALDERREDAIEVEGAGPSSVNSRSRTAYLEPVQGTRLQPASTVGSTSFRWTWVTRSPRSRRAVTGSPAADDVVSDIETDPDTARIGGGDEPVHLLRRLDERRAVRMEGGRLARAIRDVVEQVDRGRPSPPRSARACRECVARPAARRDPATLSATHRTSPPPSRSSRVVRSRRRGLRRSGRPRSRAAGRRPRPGAGRAGPAGREAPRPPGTHCRTGCPRSRSGRSRRGWSLRPGPRDASSELIQSIGTVPIGIATVRRRGVGAKPHVVTSRGDGAHRCRFCAVRWTRRALPGTDSRACATRGRPGQRPLLAHSA